MANDRRKSEEAGRSAELIALWALRLKGWRLLARRYKTHVGEVDLIMRRGDVTAFIEVKARKNLDRAVESVTPRQARRIAAAARQGHRLHRGKGAKQPRWRRGGGFTPAGAAHRGGGAVFSGGQKPGGTDLPF